MSSLNNRKTGGFSLVEVIVTIAVMGILSALGMAAYGNITKASKETIAQNLVETLNNATKEFGHAQYSLLSDGENASADDEQHILQTLQWQDPSIELGVAGPFMRPNWIPTTSDSDEEYRAVWAGSFWKLARPGESGVGLQINFQATDVGVSFTHGSDFSPYTYVESDDSVDVDN